MFASKVAKPQTKAAESPTSKLALRRLPPVTRPFDGGADELPLFFQRTIGNQGATQRIGWDFGRIAILPPDRAKHTPAQSERASDRDDQRGDAGGKVVVEGFPEASEKRLTPPEPEAAESPPSQEPAREKQAPQIAVKRPWASLTPGWGADRSSQPPAGGQIARMGLAGSRPQAVSWAALQTLPKDGGALISGPPVATTLSSVWTGGSAGAAGYTAWPAGYKAPDFAFNTTPTAPPAAGAGSGAGAPAPAPQWTSRPTVTTAAFEGTSGSFYTDAGKYKTGTQEGGKDVYWNFSAGISATVKTGEQEHCDDYAEAYRISLKEADTILNANIRGKEFGPKASKADAEQLVLAEITAKLTHAPLGNDKTQWAAKYNTLFTKTLTRDTSKWHSISLGTRSVDATGNVTYDLAKGTAQIPGPASNTIIKY